MKKSPFVDVRALPEAGWNASWDEWRRSVMRDGLLLGENRAGKTPVGDAYRVAKQGSQKITASAFDRDCVCSCRAGHSMVQMASRVLRTGCVRPHSSVSGKPRSPSGNPRGIQSGGDPR